MLVDTDQLLSITGIAKLLGKSPQLIRHYAAKGHIPNPIDICGHRFYTKDSIKQWKPRFKRDAKK